MLANNERELASLRFTWPSAARDEISRLDAAYSSCREKQSALQKQLDSADQEIQEMQSGVQGLLSAAAAGEVEVLASQLQKIMETLPYYCRGRRAVGARCDNNQGRIIG
eukprot:gnl/MRDRNA2_/MRDRNA2_71928_c0_seq2.p2 gnl/MRDRNA2_/MRDRNA2_71928_c0~~gnl/MRDRNA2_/MRDRNA2_71928_c0_seq2.p2  ORF type:complete len:109 (+),score=25.09 gnl/MRDRNA2_/MRDRNA2_71928_c0_seq2:2-328(+)